MHYVLGNVHVCAVCVTSFPGCSHLPSLIACSMQIRTGKACEIWSLAVTSGRQMVDTQEVPDCNSSRYMFTRPWRCRQRTCFVNTLASSLRTDITGKGFCEVLHRALPPVCLPDVTARNQISQAFPAYCKRRWEWPGNKAIVVRQLAQ